MSWFRHKFQKIILVTFALLFFYQDRVFAFSPFIVEDIRIDGTFHVPEKEILSNFPAEIGKLFSEENAKNGIHVLYSTGFFKFIEIKKTRKNQVIISVQENPIISSIDLSKVKKLKSPDIRNLLKEIDFMEGEIFNKIKLKQAKDIIKDECTRTGDFNVKINSSEHFIGKNCLEISFFEEKLNFPRIVQIKILGCKNFQEKKLLQLLQLKASNFLNFSSKCNKYSPEKFQEDIEHLRSHYLNQGYLEYISNPHILFSSDLKKVKLTININEGKIYKIRSIDIVGNIAIADLNIEEIRKLISVNPGDTFDARRVNQSLEDIKFFLGKIGYAFADVDVSRIIDRTLFETDITFHVNPGNRIYVEKVNINGNYRTYDSVIRKEIRQKESSWYNLEDIEFSYKKIAKLGFFSDVKINTEAVPNILDRVSINFLVKEKPTGFVNLGIGYGSCEKMVLSTTINEENIFGSGKSLNLDLNTGRKNRTFLFSYIDPDFIQSNASFSFLTKYKLSDPWNKTSEHFRLRSKSIAMNLGIPISENRKIYLGNVFEQSRISPNENAPLSYHKFVNEHGNLTNSISTNFAWIIDKRDNTSMPTKGFFSNLKANISTLDLQYYTITANYQHYFKFQKTSILMLNVLADYGASYSRKTYPIIKNFFAGGISTVRCYDERSLGPKDPKSGNYLGGNSRIIANIQITLPMIENQKENLRCFLFLDAGRIYEKNILRTLSTISDKQENLGSFGWRFSTGIGFYYQSLFGPIQLSYGIPINKKEGDKIQNFQFQVGTNF